MRIGARERIPLESWQPIKTRLKIYTKKGDDGRTGLLGISSRVSKSSARVSTYGDVDELNSVLGVVRSENRNSKLDEILEKVQRDLFSIGSELATLTGPSDLGKRIPAFPRITINDVQRLEHDIDKAEEILIPLTKFILPGGTKAASFLHVARSVCRRVERGVVALGENDTINPVIQAYLNRLSDLLFVLARESNSEAGIRDNQWAP